MAKYLTIHCAVILAVGLLAGAALHKRGKFPAALTF